MPAGKDFLYSVSMGTRANYSITYLLGGPPGSRVRAATAASRPAREHRHSSLWRTLTDAPSLIEPKEAAYLRGEVLGAVQGFVARMAAASEPIAGGRE